MFWNNFKIAFSMYSKIPMPRSDWNQSNMKYVMCFFPLVGVAIGILMELWMAVVGNFPEGGRLLLTAGLVLIPVAVTGGIHLDGFLDTSDAMSSWQPMEKRLEILKDSRCGAFAVIMGCCYFLLSFGVWSCYDWCSEAFHVICISFVVSRTLSGYAIVAFRKAKNTGLAAMFSEGADKRCVQIWMIVYLVAMAALMLWLTPLYGTLALITVFLVFAYYRHMAYKYFGGITGDLAGWFLQVCELAVALVLAVAMFLFG